MSTAHSGSIVNEVENFRRKLTFEAERAFEIDIQCRQRPLRVRPVDVSRTVSR